MKPAEYWTKRSEQVILEAERGGAELTQKLGEFYAETESQIQLEVEAFFGRYASDEGISIEEAQKRLTKTDLRRFHEALRRYHAEASRLGLDKQYEQHLRTLAGRTYISRQVELLAQARHQIELLFGKTEHSFSGVLADVYHNSYHRNIFYMQQGLGFGSDFARMDTKTIEMLLRKPWLGENFSSRLWQNKARLLQQLEQTVPRAFATGENSRVLGQQLASRLGVSRSAGECLIRTEVNHAANEAAKVAYKEVGVEKYEYLATLDNRTSEICAALDGKVFRVADAAAGINYPPMHPHCRSSTIPYFPPDEFDGPASRAARDNDGKYYTVPADMKYDEWRHKYARSTFSKKRKNLNAELQHIVDAPFLKGIVPAGALLTHVMGIAGYKTSVDLRETPRLVNLYGGKDWRWEKKSGTIITDNFQYEIHWYEYDGRQYDLKLKHEPKKKGGG